MPAQGGDGEEQQRALLRSLIFLVSFGLAVAIQEYEGALSWVAAAGALAWTAGLSLLVGAVAEASVRRAPTTAQELAAAIGLALVAGSVAANALVVHSWPWMLAGGLTLAGALVHARAPTEPEPGPPAAQIGGDLQLEELEPEELAEYQAEQARIAQVERRDDERRARATEDRDEFPRGYY